MKNIFAAALALAGFAAFAGELDLPNGQKLPQGIVVRVDANGNEEVFKADGAKVTNDASAKAVVDSFVKVENKIAISSAKGELDQGSSSPAWFWGGRGWGCGYYGYGCGGYYNYGGYYYNYYGYNYNYYPCYGYNYGGYGYRYYYWY